MPTAAALGVTATIGVAKELADLGEQPRRFSCKDLAYDALGVAFGYIVFIHDFGR